MVDAYGVCINAVFGVSVCLQIHSLAYTYSAWASALLVLDGLGNARRLEEWDERQAQHPRFFVCVLQ